MTSCDLWGLCDHYYPEVITLLCETSRLVIFINDCYSKLDLIFFSNVTIYVMHKCSYRCITYIVTKLCIVIKLK